MGEMLENRAVATQTGPEHAFAVILIAGPQDVIVGACYVSDRVDLNKAQPPDHTHHVERPGGGLAQAIGPQPEATGITVRDGQSGSHGAKLWLRASCRQGANKRP